MNKEFIQNIKKVEYLKKNGKSVFGIFGDPVSHSLSPLMHNNSFSIKKITAEYLPFYVKKAEVKEAMRIALDTGIDGLNITIPHKSSVIPLLDEIHPAAKKIGAVNTIVFREGKSKGFNTDVDGFILPIKQYIELIKYEDVTVFGGGGSARAVLFAMLQNFSFPKINLLTRNEKKGNKLLDEAEYWKKHGTILEWCDFSNSIQAAEYIWESRLLINCTPIGMTGNNAEFPFSLARFFRPGQVAYDLIYTPLETSFLRESEKRGGQTISGLEMLIQQGAKAFRIWTGKTMPVKEIRSILKEKLLPQNKR
ncbi:shikimate dehydrogenase [candidate division KSB1 bacterium]